MVFSSLPPYLHPSNFPQNPNPQTDGTTVFHGQFTSPSQPPPSGNPLGSGGGGGGSSSIRPGSMVERARIENIPMPETSVKCPRCESTNTKFCYFNNYSLSQPRHFCKTCRRYWTRGGTLRTVPVGGGCRRNKKTKGNHSKSPTTVSSNPETANIIRHAPPQLPQPHFTEFGGGSNMHWRVQNTQVFPFVGGGELDCSPAGFQYDGGYLGAGGGSGQVRANLNGIFSNEGLVKMEDNQGQMNFSRQLLGIQGNDQYWNGTSTSWIDL